jgi:hypothetical protein
MRFAFLQVQGLVQCLGIVNLEFYNLDIKYFESSQDKQFLFDIIHISSQIHSIQTIKYFSENHAFYIVSVPKSPF